MAHAHSELPAEPKTPFWFTALGGALFVAAGLFWVLSNDPPEAAPSPEPAAAAKPVATATAAPAPGTAPTAHIDPKAFAERFKRMREQIQQGANGQPGAAPAADPHGH